MLIQETGERYGDMFEVSHVRREDYDLVRDKSGEFVDVLQCNNLPSSRTPRGHQMPAAFLSWVISYGITFFIWHNINWILKIKPNRRFPVWTTTCYLQAILWSILTWMWQAHLGIYQSQQLHHQSSPLPCSFSNEKTHPFLGFYFSFFL